MRARDLSGESAEGGVEVIGATAIVLLVVLVVAALDEGPADRRRPW